MNDAGFMPSRLIATAVAAVLAASVVATVAPNGARAERIQNPVAVFAALDKVTARISELKVPINETVQFGSLKLMPRTCLTSAPTEQPKTTTFVEVNEVQLDGQETELFAGWMFAESPGLHAVEHPVFDIWLTGCEGGRQVEAGRTDAESAQERRRPTQRRRRRVRR